MYSKSTKSMDVSSTRASRSNDSSVMSGQKHADPRMASTMEVSTGVPATARARVSWDTKQFKR